MVLLLLWKLNWYLAAACKQIHSGGTNIWRNFHLVLTMLVHRLGLSHCAIYFKSFLSLYTIPFSLALDARLRLEGLPNTVGKYKSEWLTQRLGVFFAMTKVRTSMDLLFRGARGEGWNVPNDLPFHRSIGSL